MEQNEKNIVDLRKTHTIHWEVEEFSYQEKSLRWFIVGGILLFGLFIGLIILKNIFGAAVILLFGIIILIYATKKPNILNITIDYKGISINNIFVSYTDIASFWLVYEPQIKELIIIKKEHFTPKMLLPLGDTNPLIIREILTINGGIEKEEEESLTDIIARKFRF